MLPEGEERCLETCRGEVRTSLSGQDSSEEVRCGRPFRVHWERTKFGTGREKKVEKKTVVLSPKLDKEMTKHRRCEITRKPQKRRFLPPHKFHLSKGLLPFSFPQLPSNLQSTTHPEAQVQDVSPRRQTSLTGLLDPKV